jgi:hypothetical protein
MKDLNAFHNQTSEVLGEEFWQDMAGLIPNTRPRIDIYYTSTEVVVLVEIPDLHSQDQIGHAKTCLNEGHSSQISPWTAYRGAAD